MFPTSATWLSARNRADPIPNARLLRRLENGSCRRDGVQVDVEQRLLLVALLRVLLAQPNHFAQDLHVEAVALGLLIDFLLVFVQRLDLFLDPLDALDDGAQLIAGDPT